MRMVVPKFVINPLNQFHVWRAAEKKLLAENNKARSAGKEEANTVYQPPQLK